jgi:hypothetical protein
MVAESEQEHRGILSRSMQPGFARVGCEVGTVALEG